jgi:hypothetical protein
MSNLRNDIRFAPAKGLVNQELNREDVLFGGANQCNR